MIYFLIIGIFIAPFLLNITRSLFAKPKIVTHPLFFMLFSLAAFQIGLSWFTIFDIGNFLVFSIITYLLISVIILSVCGMFGYALKQYHSQLTIIRLWEIIKPSLFIGIINTIPLIVIAAQPSLTLFSDTQAYVNASSYFYGNAKFTFDGINQLGLTYRVPVGYYVNSVFAAPIFILTYRFLWPAITFYLFSWLIHYYAETKLKNWNSWVRLGFVLLLSSLYIVLSFVSIYIFTSGNLEMQALFALTSLIFLSTKNAKYIILSTFSFLFFSTTAGLIGPAFVAIAFIYLLFKGTWMQFLYWIIGILALALVAIAFILEASQYEFDDFRFLGIVATAIMIIGPLAIWLNNVNFHGKISRNHMLLTKQVVPPLRLQKILSKTNLGNVYNFKTNSLGQTTLKQQATLFTVYFLSSILVFLLTVFVTSKSTGMDKNLVYSVFAVLGVSSIYSIYLLIKRKGPNRLTFWFIWFNFAYILIATILGGLRTFENNASIWRIIYITNSIGNFSTYIGVFGILGSSVLLDHEHFFKSLFTYHKHSRVSVIRHRKVLLSTIGINLALFSLASGVTGISWTIRNDQINTILKDGDDPINTGLNPWDNNWTPTNTDISLLKTLNDKKQETGGKLARIKESNSVLRHETVGKLARIKESNSVLRHETVASKNVYTNDMRSEFPYFTYYSDISLSGSLNNGSSFTYGPSWEATFANDFIKSDTRMHVVQSNPINNLLYYEIQNTITNINRIINLSLMNIQTNAAVSWNAGIYASSIGNDINVPIKAKQILVQGAPDLIILNRNTRYYDSLEMVKSAIVKNDFTYMLPGSSTVSKIGYKLISESATTAFFINTISKNISENQIKVINV